MSRLFRMVVMCFINLTKLDLLKYIAVILLLVLGSMELSFAQDKYRINGKVLVENYDFKGVKVHLATNGRSNLLNLSEVGIFTTDLDWNKVYRFSFSKPGYVSKIVEFSTVIPDDRSHDIEPFYMTVRLFPMFEGVDTIFFKRPVAKVYYDEKENDFTDDRDYAMKVVYRIKQMREKSERKAKTLKKKQVPLITDDSKSAARTPVQALDEKKEKSVEITDKAKSIVDTGTEDTVKGHVYDLPALKNTYPPGKTVEKFYVGDKEITRVIIRDESKQDVFYRVKHAWGGVYYFIDESPLGIFAVTENSFERYTGLSVSNRERADIKSSN